MAAEIVKYGSDENFEASGWKIAEKAKRKSLTLGLNLPILQMHHLFAIDTFKRKKILQNHS